MRALTRRSAAVGLAAAVVLTGATACGSSTKSGSTSKVEKQAAADPQAAFATALSSLSSRKEGTVTISFAGTKDEITAFAKASSSDFTAQDQKIAEYLADGDVVVRTKDGLTDIAVNLNGDALFELIGTAKSDLYIKADVARVAKLAGSDVATLQKQTSSLPPQFSFVKDAIAGRWLVLDGAGVKQLQQLAQSQTKTGASATPDAAALQAKLTALLKENFTATDAGSTDKGEHLVLTGNTKKLLTSFQSFAASIPGAGAFASKADVSANAPDQAIVIDAYVKDSGLSLLSIDLAQFATGADAKKVAGKHLPMEVAFASSGGDISTPKDAVKVDLNALLSGVLGGGLSGLGSS